MLQHVSEIIRLDIGSPAIRLLTHCNVDVEHTMVLNTKKHRVQTPQGPSEQQKVHKNYQDNCWEQQLLVND